MNEILGGPSDIFKTAIWFEVVFIASRWTSESSLMKSSMNSITLESFMSHEISYVGQRKGYFKDQ